MALLSDYTAGTVTVSAGGTAVTGVGTAWISAGFQEGDEFFAAGWHGIVQSVQSNTALTLYPLGIRGAALSGVAYRLRYQGDAPRLTAQARQLIELLGSGNLDALSSLLGAANKLPCFTGAGTMGLADFKEIGRALLAASDSAAAYSALGEVPNNQIPSRLRQLGSAVSSANALNMITETGVVAVTTTGAVTTVGGPAGAPAGVCFTLMSAGSDSGVQIYYGYSGSADRSWTRRKLGNVWQPWQITSIPIVGTVSQISGQPFGAIIERGSNANGEYVRFADGTQWCWGSRNPNASTAGSNYFGSTSGAAVIVNDTLDFPATFANADYRFTATPTFRGFVVLGAYSKTTGRATSRLGNPGAVAADVPYDWLAVGRWF